MLDFYSPNMPECMADTDSKSISNAVRLAVENNIGKIIIPRKNARTGNARWDIDSAILLPSDIHVVLDNCYIRQVDGTFDNVFRNENMYTDGFATAEKFLQEGATVILTASSPENAEKAVAKLKEAYPQAMVMGISPAPSVWWWGIR